MVRKDVTSSNTSLTIKLSKRDSYRLCAKEKTVYIIQSLQLVFIKNILIIDTMTKQKFYLKINEDCELYERFDL